jgi:hypothetical protein
MKKTFLLFIATVMSIFLLAYTSCKKVTHPTHPTPDNYRLFGYNKITTRTIVMPLTLTPVVTENYRFVYDGNNRVSQIFFTSNDSTKVNHRTGDLSIKFTYVADSIFKVTTDVRTSTVMERDTFIINGIGQITDAYFPMEVHNFVYYGKLLANETISYRDTNTVIKASVSYTSNNGDFLSRFFDGNLIASFPDTGIRPPDHIVPGDTIRDTVISYPIDVTWTITNPAGITVPVTHTGVSGHTDGLSGYFSSFITVDAVDANGVKVRTGYFPNTYPAQQFYQIYDFLDNRPGDYLHLQSFTTYGVDIYQEVHMLKSISSAWGTINATYTIDGDSKVTNTSVVIRDSLLKNIVAEDYKLQYETY